MQLRKDNLHCPHVPPPIKVKEIEDIKDEAVTTTLRRAINFYSTIQAHDGHWPAEFAGPLFFSPLLVCIANKNLISNWSKCTENKQIIYS